MDEGETLQKIFSPAVTVLGYFRVMNEEGLYLVVMVKDGKEVEAENCPMFFVSFLKNIVIDFF